MKRHVWSRSTARLDELRAMLPRLGGAALDEWAAGYAAGQGDRIAFDVDYLLAHHDVTTCLNVGGAPYLFEYLLKKQRPDARVETVDLDKDRFPHAEAVLDIKIHSIDIERSPAELARVGRYRCVVLCEVIEHLRVDLLATLTALRATVEPDGVLYLSTPNGVGTNGLKRTLLHHRTGPDPITEWSKLRTLGHMGHVREYSLLEITSLLASTGFRVRDAFFRIGERWPRSLGARGRNWVQRGLTRVVPSLSNEIVVIAQPVA